MDTLVVPSTFSGPIDILAYVENWGPKFSNEIGLCPMLMLGHVPICLSEWRSLQSNIAKWPTTLAIHRQGPKAVENLQPPTPKFLIISVFIAFLPKNFLRLQPQPTKIPSNFGFYCIFNEEFFRLQQSPTSLTSPLPNYDPSEL